MVPARNTIKHPITMFYNSALNKRLWCEALRTNIYRFCEINHSTPKISLTNNSPHQVPYSSSDVILENLVLEHVMIPKQK